jgi:hypothetical protein
MAVPSNARAESAVTISSVADTPVKAAPTESTSFAATANGYGARGLKLAKDALVEVNPDLSRLSDLPHQISLAVHNPVGATLAFANDRLAKAGSVKDDGIALVNTGSDAVGHVIDSAKQGDVGGVVVSTARGAYAVLEQTRTLSRDVAAVVDNPLSRVTLRPATMAVNAATDFGGPFVDAAIDHGRFCATSPPDPSRPIARMGDAIPRMTCPHKPAASAGPGV